MLAQVRKRSRAFAASEGCRVSSPLDSVVPAAFVFSAYRDSNRRFDLQLTGGTALEIYRELCLRLPVIGTTPSNDGLPARGLHHHAASRRETAQDHADVVKGLHSLPNPVSRRRANFGLAGQTLPVDVKAVAWRVSRVEPGRAAMGPSSKRRCDAASAKGSNAWCRSPSIRRSSTVVSRPAGWWHTR